MKYSECIISECRNLLTGNMVMIQNPSFGRTILINVVYVWMVQTMTKLLQCHASTPSMFTALRSGGWQGGEWRLHVHCAGRKLNLLKFKEIVVYHMNYCRVIFFRYISSGHSPIFLQIDLRKKLEVGHDELTDQPGYLQMVLPQILKTYSISTRQSREFLSC